MYIAINIVYNILINQLTDQSVADEIFDDTSSEYSIVIMFIECLVVKADCY